MSSSKKNINPAVTEAVKFIDDFSKSLRDYSSLGKSRDGVTALKNVENYTREHPTLKPLADSLISRLKSGKLTKIDKDTEIHKVKSFLALLFDGTLPIAAFVSLSDEEEEYLAKSLEVPSMGISIFKKALQDKLEALTTCSPPLSKVQQYTNLLRSDYKKKSDILGESDFSLGLNVSDSAPTARRIALGAMLAPNTPIMANLFDILIKDNLRHCCPPFSNLRWQSRYDYYTEDSRLKQILDRIRDDIVEQIKECVDFISAHKSLFKKYGLYDIPDTNKDVMGLEKEFDQITDPDKIKEYIINIRQELENLKGLMKINCLGIYIAQGVTVPPPVRWDYDKISIYLIEKDGNPFDIKPSLAGSDYAEGVYPVNLNIFNFDCIRISYDESAWFDFYFGCLQIAVSYTPNNAITDLLKPAIECVEWSETMPQPDFIVLDLNSRYFCVGEENEYKADPNCCFSQVIQEVEEIGRVLDEFLGMLDGAETGNPFFANYDRFKNLLSGAAQNFRNHQYAFARSKYIEIFGKIKDHFKFRNLPHYLVEGRVKTNEQAFMFALLVLIADTFKEEGAFPYAYKYLDNALSFADGGYCDIPAGFSSLREKYAHLEKPLGDDKQYLWLKLADLFIRWGDKLYATAGSSYESRMEAIRKYQKVVDESLYFHDDNCEEEIRDLWIDIGSFSKAHIQDVIKIWSESLKIATYRIVRPLNEPDGLPSIDKLLPIVDVQIFPEYVFKKRGDAQFIRIRVDVSEAGLKRSQLRLCLATSLERFKRTKWLSGRWVRLHVGFEFLLPSELRETLQFYSGSHKNIYDYSIPLGEPEKISPAKDALITYDMVCWYLDFDFSITKSSSDYPRRILPKGTCEQEYLMRLSRMRIDQIESHLNFLGVHDEYVPTHRFEYLHEFARQLAVRAAKLEARVIQFMDRAETETLSQMEAEEILETARQVQEIAAERLSYADTSLEAIRAQLHAARVAEFDANRAQQLFESTYQGQLERFCNSISIGVGISGPSVGTTSGALHDRGYDDQFNLQSWEYAARTKRAQANVQQSEFNLSLVETEYLIAQENVILQAFKADVAADRVNFLKFREMNATAWYQMVNMYRELHKTIAEWATRWAWMAERALEFETNSKIDLIRMDYADRHLGMEQLINDLVALLAKKNDFRERYRDVPNIIEREFHFSHEYPEQLRILTSTEPSSEMEPVSGGLRRVSFTTDMSQYDSKIPGRYAFERILGVEVEIQGDIGGGVVTGHLENAKIIYDPESGINQRLSSSLVRVPKPVETPLVPRCSEDEQLKSHIPDWWDFLEAAEWDASLAERWAAEAAAKIVGSTGMTYVFLSRKKSSQAAVEAPSVDLEGLLERADHAGVNAEWLRKIVRLKMEPDDAKTLAALNSYANKNAPLLKFDFGDLEPLKELLIKQPVLTTKMLHNLLHHQLQRKAQTWWRYKYGWSSERDIVVCKDLTERYSRPPEQFDYVPDYVDYSDHDTEYVFRIKNHEPDCLSISTYRKSEDALVFNVYNPGDVLGTFENCGIHMDWTLTLKAMSDDRSGPVPLYDRIREIIFRVWYHAAYERREGPRLADHIHRAIMQRGDLSLSILVYRDFYDEFITLAGDYPSSDPAAASGVRSFTDYSHPTTGGWIPFTLAADFIPFDNRRINAMFLVILSTDVHQMPNYNWSLRYGEDGPEYQGTSRGPDLGAVVTAMSNKFRGLNPRNTWYFRLAEADNNAGKDLAFIQNIEMFIEYEV